MSVLLYLGIFWVFYGIVGLFGWQRINPKYKGHDWTKDYVRCMGISWLMIGIPAVIFDRVFAAGYNSAPMFLLMLICMMPSIVYTIVIEKKYNGKLKDL